MQQSLIAFVIARLVNFWVEQGMSLTDFESKLVAEQQPLGEDLEAVLVSNLDELYEEEDDNDNR